MTNFFNKRQSAGQTVDSVEEYEIVSAIKNSLNVDEPDDMRMQRMLRKIEAKNIPSKRTFLYGPRVAAVLVLAVLLFSVGALISRSNLPAGKGKAANIANITILQKALAAVEKPDMVTYYKISNRAKANGQDQPMDNATVDLWVDPKSDNAKFIESFSNRPAVDGMLPMTKHIVIIANNRMTRADEREGRLIEARETALKDAFNDDYVSGGSEEHLAIDMALLDTSSPVYVGFRGYLIDAARQYTKLLKERKLKVTGEEHVNGIATYKLEPASLDNMSFDLINVRKDDYRPVRIVHQVTNNHVLQVFTDKGGPAPDVTRQTVTYVMTSTFDEVKLLRADALGKDFFTLDSELKNKDYSLRSMYSLEEAKAFDKFDLYYLGDSFTGLEFDTTMGVVYQHPEKEAIFPNDRGLKIPLSESVGMNYIKTDGKGNPVSIIYTSIYPKLSTAQADGLMRVSGMANLSETRVQVGDSSATLIEGNPKDHGLGWVGYTAQLFMNKGGVIIHLTGNDKDLLLKAAKSLKKLN